MDFILGQPNDLFVILFYPVSYPLFLAESMHLFGISSVARSHLSLLPVIIADERTRVTQNNRNKRRRAPPNQTIINCDLYINLESSSNSTVKAILQYFVYFVCLGHWMDNY
jgi:hypothetical protein